MSEQKMDERSKEAVTLREKYKADLDATKDELARVKAELEATKSARTDAQRTEMSTERREEYVKLKDGPQLNFEVWGEIPGYHMHIVVDQDGDIERQLYRGYNFVEFGEVPTNASKKFDASADNRVSWHAGTDEGGRPYRAYLMKMEQRRYDEINEARNSQSDADHERLKNGVLADGEGRYIPQRGTNMIR